MRLLTLLGAGLLGAGLLGAGLLSVGSANAAVLFLDSNGKGSVDLAPGESVEISIMITIRDIDPGYQYANVYFNDGDQLTNGEIDVTAFLPEGDPGPIYFRDFILPADLSWDAGNEFSTIMATDLDGTGLGGDGTEATFVIDTLTVTHNGSSAEGIVELTFEPGARAPEIFSTEWVRYIWGTGFEGVIPAFVDPGVGAEDNPFIINLVPGPISFVYPNGLPDAVAPNSESSVLVNLVDEASEPVPGTGTVSYRIDDSEFVTIDMAELAPNEYEATLPALDCGEVLDFYFTAETIDGVLVTDPGGPPDSTFSTFAAFVAHDFNDDPGWTATDHAFAGAWERGDPVDDFANGPLTDYDGSGQCFLTSNSVDEDVDDGAVMLTSISYDLIGLSDPQVSYARWFSNSEESGDEDNPHTDEFIVEVSADGGASWVNLETVGPGDPEVDGEWFVKTFYIADFVPITDQFQIRFITSDQPGHPSVVEAAVDAFAICGAAVCEGDANGDGTVDPLDSGFVLARFGCEVGGGDPDCNAADQNGDGVVDPLDSGFVLARFGPCE